MVLQVIWSQPRGRRIWTARASRPPLARKVLFTSATPRGAVDLRRKSSAATTAWLKENKPEALDSKVEFIFRSKGWKIIWTPPYCPKFQPIELVWGVGKQRVGTLYKPRRNLFTTRRHLRRGWYGEKGKRTARFEPCNVRGC